MTCCILAEPCEGTIFADIGEYSGPCDPDEMVSNDKFVPWGGRVAKYFVPVPYYLDFMPDGPGVDLYNKSFGEFTHFAFFEYQGEPEDYTMEQCEVWIDEDSVLMGPWLLLMYCEDEGYKWFNADEDAQTIFIWLTAPEIQGMIYEKNQLTGSQFPRAHASKVN